MPFYLVIAILMIAFDQAVKQWAFTVLKAQATIPVVEGVFHFTYVENRGAAFSLFSGLNSPWIFAALAVIVSLVIFFVLRKGLMQTWLGKLSLLLISAGALGNALDRGIRGFVVDMFDFRLIHFPVFNVADILICVGGVLFAWYVMFQHKDNEEAHSEEAVEPYEETGAGEGHE